jgi:NAD(P)-dependent dehydrogenase (short-subunit alcohol dehydrogenase family)
MLTLQAPIGSGFRAASTAAEVIQGCDLTGKVAIVTGGYAGLGLETAKTLAFAGAKVIVPARDQAKARKALENLEGISMESLDLMDPSSIDQFADRFLSWESALHILINNAAVMANPLTRDSRGYESQFSTNHLGHFQLTSRLWPALRRAKGARVVALTSVGHRYSGVDFEDPNFEHRPYDPWVSYGQSKTANALFALSLDQLGESYGVRAFSVHPGGIVATDLGRHMDPERLKAMGYVDAEGRAIIDPERNMKNIEQGAAASVWCATSRSLDGQGGFYCENCDVASPIADDSPEPRGVRSWATNPELAARLWRLSEKLTGVVLPV